MLTGPNPVDRGKPGSKYHLLVDRRGVPLAVVLSAAMVQVRRPSAGQAYYQRKLAEGKSPRKPCGD